MLIMDSDQQEQYRISRMTIEELLDYVLAHPEYLTDSYYRGFDRAIYDRAEELKRCK